MRRGRCALSRRAPRRPRRAPPRGRRARACRLVGTGLPLVRVPNGGSWGFTPRAPFTEAERWLGVPTEERPDHDGLVRRYLAAFGPASVRDAERG
ncbi:MAG TPA: crosslink repair DNA glycosylase YcaQ family protein [Thermoleophilaceae bacterium]|nr:crosslink repair DNA glycosylase YcaQ family protein [Thermoleophilaceae bacterium]